VAVRIKVFAALLPMVLLAGGCSDSGSPANMATQSQNDSAAASVSAPAADEKLVVAFGDSLYAGYQLEQNQGFAPVLEQALKAKGIAARVQNAGVSGDTTAAGLQRLAFTLDGQPRKPDLVIVGLGGNDMLRGLSPDETRANLDAILTELDKRGIETVMTGMLASPNMGPDYARDFNAVFPALAKKHKALLYPFFLDGVVGHRELILADGIHPNDKGVKIIVGHVAPVIAKALTD